MNPIAKRRVFGALTALTLGTAALLTGRWLARLEADLEREGSYPWGLHRMIAGARLDCESFGRSGAHGGYHVQMAAGGEVIFIASYDRARSLGTVHAINAAGAHASDTVGMTCP